MNNLEIIKKYSEQVWHEKNLSDIDQFLAADVVITSPLAKVTGIDAMLSIVASWHAGLSHINVSWDDFVCEGDKVVSIWTAKGQHTGELLGHPATNHKVRYQGITIYKLTDGKVVEYQALVDISGLEKQLSQAAANAA